jgi:pyrroloquinoline quinone (PQQ) biosynthesis protein C
MATATDNQAFVDSLLNDIILPGVDDLLDSRYFRDLRAGKLTVRRMQGFSIQHYIHNMGILKAFALGAAQHAPSDRAFMAYAQGMGEELTHPALCMRFGISLGLTEEDFTNAQPVFADPHRRLHPRHVPRHRSSDARQRPLQRDHGPALLH